VAEESQRRALPVGPGWAPGEPLGDNARATPQVEVQYGVVVQGRRVLVKGWAAAKALLGDRPLTDLRHFWTAEAAETWAARAAGVDPLPEAGVDVPPVPQRRRREAWLISVCDGTGVPRLAAQVATIHAARNGVDWIWTRVVVVERDAQVRQFAGMLTRQAAPDMAGTLLEPEVVEHLEGLEEWGLGVLQAGVWNPERALVIMAGTDCTSLSQANPANLTIDGQVRRMGRRGLHQEPSCSFHHFRAFLRSLGMGGCAGSMGVLTEMVVAANPLDEEELTEVCGTPTTVDAGLFAPRGGAQRIRRFRCTPQVASPANVVRAFVERGWPVGWKWVGQERDWSGRDGVPPTLTAYYPRLVARAAAVGVRASDMDHVGAPARLRRLAQERHHETFTAQEVARLRGLRVISPEGEVVYPPVQCVAAWFGLDARGWPGVPCLCTIPLLTGGSPGERAPCGVFQWCDACEHKVRVLGRAWHLGCAVSMAIPLFQAVDACMLEGGRGRDWSRVPAHTCGPACPLRA
jgi:hypothetical protein